jgi:Flp pilus assembly protein TadD
MVLISMLGQHYHVTRALRSLALVLALASGLVLGAAACAEQGAIERAQQLVRLHRENEAIATLRVHLEKHPDDIPARRLYVRVLAFGGDLEGAKREVDELQKRMPDDPVPWIELGHAFELSHRFEEALAAYDTAASVAPSSPAGPREGGMRCARWGEPDEALSRLEEAVKRGAHDAEIFHALGLVRLNLRDFEGAEEAYKQGLAADPKSHENLLGLATVAVVKDDPAAALAAYDRLLAAKPSFAPAELGRAWALAKLGKRDDAKRALDHAEELGAPRANVDKQRQNLH